MEPKPVLKFKKLHPLAQIPVRATSGSAGMDLCAPDGAWVSLDRNRVLVSTGLAVEVPPGYELQIRPRSGLALKKGITVLNSPGTIDSDYRGEIKVLLISTEAGNPEYDGINIAPGERIAQAVLCPVPDFTVEEVTELSETTRGDGGFGSTGK